MTGSNLVFPTRLRHTWGWGASLLSLLTLSVLAQPPEKATTPHLTPPATVSVDYSSLSGPLNNPTLRDVKVNYGGSLTIVADEAQGDLPQQEYSVTGGVRIHDADTTLKASKIQFNQERGMGVAADAQLVRYPFTIRGEEIHLSPQNITAYHGSFTTAPPDVSPDYEFRADTLTLTPSQHKAILRHATLYLFHARLVTIPRIQIGLGGAGGKKSRRSATLPFFWASSRYGAYAMLEGNFGGLLPLRYQLLLPTRQVPQIRITGTQLLLSPAAKSAVAIAAPPARRDFLAGIRAFAALPGGPLPPGDPLLFHDFLPEPNPIRLFDTRSRGGLSLVEEVSNHVAAYGNRQDNLYVSRLPEIGLVGQLLLTPLPAPTPPQDSLGFRKALRHAVVYADAQAILGDYREQPSNISARRQRYQVGLSTLPLLIAPNTIVLPRVSITTNGYSGSKDSYHFSQISLSAAHDFTPYSALGVQFSASNVRGTSPFNFDVLDTSREMDVRLQIGNRRLAVAGEVRYDLTRSSIIDYKAAIAPGLAGFTPVISYNFRNRSIGLGVEIPGITF